MILLVVWALLVIWAWGDMDAGLPLLRKWLEFVVAVSVVPLVVNCVTLWDRNGRVAE